MWLLDEHSIIFGMLYYLATKSLAALVLKSGASLLEIYLIYFWEIDTIEEALSNILFIEDYIY